MDADRRGKNFLVVSRGGNYVIRAAVGSGRQAHHARRQQHGAPLPDRQPAQRRGHGRDAASAPTPNNELNTSMTAMNLDDNTVIARDIESSAPPAPGTAGASQPGRQAGVLHGARRAGRARHQRRRASSTSRCATSIRWPTRGKASNNAWSSCASCHDDGHSDNVTWIFETGPRQTIPLEGTFARNNLDDQRILNWSAVRGSNTDFNNNARGIQGGIGFATNVRRRRHTARWCTTTARRGASAIRSTR